MIALPTASKLLHALVALVVAGGVGLLLLAWRDHERAPIDDRLVALAAMCAGLLFGVAWEEVEFVLDWLRYSDLQLSNLDTMTDLLWNGVGAAVAGSVVVWTYCRLLDYAGRKRLGIAAAWWFDGPSRALDRHGLLATIVVALAVAVAVGALWFAGRPVPGFPIP